MPRYRIAKWEQYDLRAEAERLNQRYFNGDLDLSFPFRYNASLRLYGQVKAILKPSKEIDITELSISNRFNLDYDAFVGILAHELIHVQQFQCGALLFDGSHGIGFRREIDRLRGLGLEVPLSENVGQHEQDFGKPFPKPVHAFVLNEVSILVVRSFGTQQDLERFIDKMRFQAFVKKHAIKIELFTTTNPRLRQFPVKRDLTTATRTYKLPADVYAVLTADGPPAYRGVVTPEQYKQYLKEYR